ncbi:OsmC family protein [Sphingomonas suaedae]|uniref:OsmC family protein n=1 Tax=Sphingomonas suaedae TaxID=2599297 RepID=UPI001647C915|nr:OsmC family protein [Sphingomonas suaedae]
MAKPTDPKSWSISTIVEPDGPACFAFADSDLDVAAASPVEQLLAAVGSCFGQSCIAMMRYHAWPVLAVELVVKGHKPAGPLIGKGLDTLEIFAHFCGAISVERQQRLLADAKKVCTVTNSLSSAIMITVKTVETAPAL